MLYQAVSQQKKEKNVWQTHRKREQQKQRTTETDTFENGTQKQNTQVNSKQVSHAPEIPRIIFLKDLNLLDRFLFDEATAAKSKSELIKKIHQRVLEIKCDEEIGVKYMQAWEEREYDRQEAREEGLAEGLTQGRAEIASVNRLIQKLIEDNRIEDLKKSTVDKEYQEKLFEEYGIKR